MKVPYLMADPNVAQPEHPEEDWKIWTVINPATWMMPWFIVLMVQMWMIHTYALALPGYGWKDSVRVKEPVAVVAPVEVDKLAQVQ
ncbi:light-harvesting protein [Thiohalocapsa marina]|uniref:Light-harvesting protein n=1 Tax=Thiohalocapsa marina TaxID=424902 RepID=A0A5M8FCI8_9GAMM|nr:light-harvesting antenna LH1, alpha subunit [Thiohalocapsa marina]KAA6182407.1 light-harvesting protein [Thiohalocapsa marina]